TYQMGGLWMLVMRCLGGFLVAVGTGLIVERQYRKHGSKLLAPLAVPGGSIGQADDAQEVAMSHRPMKVRVSNAAETALHEFLYITLFLILGAAIAALVRQVIPHENMEAFANSKPLVLILLMMGLAIVLCLCSEADAFVAASFITLPPASKLAFLVLGPMLDFKLYFMYTRVFRPRLIATIIGSVVVQVFLYSVIVHYVWKANAPWFFEREHNLRAAFARLASGS